MSIAGYFGIDIQPWICWNIGLHIISIHGSSHLHDVVQNALPDFRFKVEQLLNKDVLTVGEFLLLGQSIQGRGRSWGEHFTNAISQPLLIDTKLTANEGNDRGGRIAPPTLIPSYCILNGTDAIRKFSLCEVKSLPYLLYPISYIHGFTSYDEIITHKDGNVNKKRRCQ